MQPTSSSTWKHKAAVWAVICLLGLALLAACRPASRPAPQADLLEATPRLAVISAFEPELKALLKQTQDRQEYVINGRTFTTGRLGGQAVVLFLSGESMVNAAMTTQLALDRFRVRAIVFSGIAGGVNPDLHIGDVVIPAEWAQYQEQLFAREKNGGWDTGLERPGLGNFGMMFPRPVSIVREGGRIDSSERKFWFAADPAMLETARQVAGQVPLKKCPGLGPCLAQEPQIRVGGKGVSGPTFVDNAAYRQWVWQNFQADALDMETAAVAHVAYANGVPFLAFRSLSDLAGGGAGQNEVLIFFQLAADNAAQVVLAFLQAYQSP